MPLCQNRDCIKDVSQMLHAPWMQSSHMDQCRATGTDTWKEISQSLYINSWSDSTRCRTTTAIVISPNSEPALLLFYFYSEPLLLPWFLYFSLHYIYRNYHRSVEQCKSTEVPGSKPLTRLISTAGMNIYRGTV